MDTVLPTLQSFLHKYVLQPDNTIIFLGHAYKPSQILRMVIFLGGYLLLRPYILKFQAKFQERDHAREIDPTEESSHSAIAAKRRPAGEESDADDDDNGAWGAKLTRRRRAEAAEIARLREEENDSDDEIAKYLDN